MKSAIQGLLANKGEVKEFQTLLGKLFPLPQNAAKMKQYDLSLRLIDQKISALNNKIDVVLNKINLIAETAIQELGIEN